MATTNGSRLERAVSLPCAERLRIVDEFFAAHPGTLKGAPGLGRAVVDFVVWLIESGRLADEGGSPWWRALNGSLVLDLAGDTPGTPGVEAWRRYSRSSSTPDGPREDLQALLWTAHQVSLHTVLPHCDDLLDEEQDQEEAFIRVAMRVVDLSAEHNQRTDTPTLGDTTRRVYPDHYPLTAPCNGELHTLAVMFGISV